MDATLPRDLITVEALAADLGDPRLRVVDVRWYLGKPGEGRRAYEAGHIPGAIYLDVDGDLAAPPGGANGGRRWRPRGPARGRQRRPPSPPRSGRLPPP